MKETKSLSLLYINLFNIGLVLGVLLAVCCYFGNLGNALLCESYYFSTTNCTSGGSPPPIRPPPPAPKPMLTNLEV